MGSFTFNTSVSNVQYFSDKYIFAMVPTKGAVHKRLKFLLVAHCSLLFACCSLVFGPCSLLFALCSLLYVCCLLVSARCSLLFPRCSLLVARYFFVHITVNEITVNGKRMVWLKRKSATDIFLANIRDFGKFFWMMVFKVVSTCKRIFKVDIKS